ncbi:hypothetical protein BU23DRAFT_604732 [Bimuria novae-zelandiae CBS 107.79]|uniref:Uncharacterized protein n=1 Tax=Bimuria novae-zelandiae CBS 107.79 TaxID=1447943 RepID=A0A6A5UIB4_9PLEO|nr:hypothetical protein BU23DRAFT_604732 [Bimuria novae-zelandiae CBS 107.79]
MSLQKAPHDDGAKKSAEPTFGVERKRLLICGAERSSSERLVELVKRDRLSLIRGAACDGVRLVAKEANREVLANIGIDEIGAVANVEDIAPMAITRGNALDELVGIMAFVSFRHHVQHVERILETFILRPGSHAHEGVLRVVGFRHG